MTPTRISILVRQRFLQRGKFAEQHPHSWLVWEVGAFAPAPAPDPDLVSTRQPPSPELLLPSKADPLCFELNRDTVRVGRAEGTEVKIPEATVSRNHLQLRLTDGIWSAQSMSSAGLATVGGQPMDPLGWRALKPEERICVGGAELVFLGPEEMIKRLDGLALR